MGPLAFTKMHGLGNDFVVIDGRRRSVALSARQARALADRQTGVGCDQVILVEPPVDPRADAFMRIRNADGGEVGACGNATRCIAAMLMREMRRDVARVETAAGVLEAHAAGNGMIRVDMGEVRFDWESIPLARRCDTLHLGIGAGPLQDPVAVNVGNPHAVFFVSDIEAVVLEEIGPLIEHHALFPEGTNVEAAQVLTPNRVRLRVWERGVGVTRACGTGACATVAAGVRRGLIDRSAEVVLDGGVLGIRCLKNGHVTMTGPVAISFTGTIDPSLLAV
jgi:diaminopimelate epimerase